MQVQQINSWQDGYHFSSDKSLMQWDAIHNWLSVYSYWSKGISFEMVKTAGEHSFCIGIFNNNLQVGYARIITDYNTFGYLADVYVLETHRQKGLSKKLMDCIVQLNWVKGLRRFMLATKDAHELYKKFGFITPAHPDRLMEITQPDIYLKKMSNELK